MKTFSEKYPNFISSRNCQAIKLSEHSWVFRGSKLDFKRYFLFIDHDELNFIWWNKSSKEIVSIILNKFYNQHL